MKEWITIEEAAALIGKTPRTVYRWVEDGRLASRVDSVGITKVLSKAVTRIAPTVKRGRPKGATRGPR